MGLGSILGGIASIGLAPFTGGTSLAWLPAAAAGGGGLVDALTGHSNQAGALSDVLGSAAGSAQKQKNTEDALKLALANYGLNKDKFAVAAPGERLATGSKAALTAALAKAGPTTVNWGGPGSGLKGQVPTFGGGFSDALKGLPGNSDYMSLLDLVGKDSLAGEKAGGATGGNKDAAMMPGMEDIGKSTLFDKILGGSAMGSSIAAALGKTMKPGGAPGSEPNQGTGDIFGNAEGEPDPFGGSGDFSGWLDKNSGLFDPSEWGNG